MTIKNLYPKARPHIIYNVINGRPELPAQASFSRASIGTYVDRAGIIRTAAVDEPRFTYDPETGESLGLLLEEARTNSQPYSNDFSTNWSLNQNGTAYVTPNAALGPSGLIDAFLLINANGAYIEGPAFIPGNNIGFGMSATYNLSTQSVTTSGDVVSASISDAGNGWYRCIFMPNTSIKYAQTVYAKAGPSTSLTIENYVRYIRLSASGGLSGGVYIWGCQSEAGTFPSSYIPTAGSAETRSADAFSLTTSSDFDNGFSLLLDSNTTTDDFIYKIKAGGSTIAELNNDNGTLDWVIDGTSAATSVPPQYPQIGAIQPGRVRTVSSFGAAGDGDQANYLYTETLSFPTVAEPAAGADELEFGVNQTVKAVYVWDGQLSNTEAVSVIKGEYNVILNEPIQADTYSFVYNTDPTNVGETSITLPYIVPTVSMRVYWGDTTSDRYEPGVTPSHTYPYPGQYRIQIEADDGFDGVRLGGSLYPNVITRVDQWPPQFRENATGPGFTGSQLYYILNNQKALGGTIPTFKYTDLTELTAAFTNCTGQVTPINLYPWEYIPTNIPLVTKMESAFSALGRYNNEASPNRVDFPTLTTSSALTNVNSCFANMKLPNFVNDRPFTVSSSVTNWRNAFTGCSLTNLIVDTSGATTLESAFARNEFVVSPNILTSNCTDFTSVMYQNTLLTNQLAWNTSSGTNFTSAWAACSSLTSFPLIDTSSGTNFISAWQDCSALTSFPLIDTSSGTKFSSAWSGCSALTSFPACDFGNAIEMTDTFRYCSSLTTPPITAFASSVTSVSAIYDQCSSLSGTHTFSAAGATNMTAFARATALTEVTFNMPNNTTLYFAFFACPNLTTINFSNASTANVRDIRSAFYQSYNMANFPNDMKFPALIWARDAWRLTPISSFPANAFDTTRTLISDAFASTWFGCALTAQSIENILVSLDTNGQPNIELGIDGGTNAAKTTWTAAANTAYTNLIGKGWTITFNP